MTPFDRPDHNSAGELVPHGASFRTPFTRPRNDVLSPFSVPPSTLSLRWRDSDHSHSWFRPSRPSVSTDSNRRPRPPASSPPERAQLQLGVDDVDSSAVLEYVPDAAVDVRPDAIDGRVTARARDDPEAPSERIVSLLAAATEIRVLTPVARSCYLRALHDAVVDGDAQAEVVTAGALTKRLQGPLGEPVCDVADTFDVSVHLYEGPVPVGVMILDETIAVGAFDEDGVLQAVLECETPELRAWARDTYESYRRDAIALRS